MKNGQQLNLKCVDCGVTFEWIAQPRQLLAAKKMTPRRCASCRRAKRELMRNAGAARSRDPKK